MRRVVAFSLAPALLLASLGFTLVRGHSLSEELLVSRFASRVEAGADFIRRFVAERERDELRVALSRFSGPTISADDYAASIEGLGFEAAVLLDQRGRLLAVHPPRPDILGTEIASGYRHLSAALRGERAVSGVVPSAARGFPVVAVAVPFETPHGRRVMSGAFSVEIGPLGSFLQGLLPFRSAYAYLIDGDGNIAASSGMTRSEVVHLDAVEPEVARVVMAGASVARTHRSIDISGDAHTLVTFPIEDTEWRLVARLSEDELLAPLRSGRWFSWAVFVGITLSTLVSVYLLGRLSTSRRKLEQTLADQRRLSAALDDFTSVAAHDLRSPMAAIRIAADLLAEPKLTDTQRAHVVGSIQRLTDRGMILIEELLDLARASGTPRIERLVPDELVEALREACPDALISAGALKGPLWADRVMLRQALLNLVRNAVAYGTRDGRAEVEISMELDSGSSVLSVADSGAGVPVEAREELFAPFARGTQSERPGFGLGLAIVRATAEAHGGRAWYEDGPGGGAVFRLALPIPPRAR